jgi:hypothetical protein
MTKKGGKQDVWTEDENLSLAAAWLSTTNELNKQKTLRGMSNSAIAKAVSKRLQRTGALGADRDVHQISSWNLRQKANFRKVVESQQQSGAGRKVALPGEVVRKGWMSNALYHALQALFGSDLAIVPPKKLLKGASGGMTQAQSEEVGRQAGGGAEQRPPWGGAAGSGSKKKKKKKKMPAKLKAAAQDPPDFINALQEVDDSSDDGSLSSGDSSGEHSSGGVDDDDDDDDDEDGDSDEEEDGDSDEEEEEELCTVLMDDNVEIDVEEKKKKKNKKNKKMKKKPTKQGTIAQDDMLRAAARKRASLDQGNRGDRKRAHEATASSTSFQAACDMVTASFSSKGGAVDMMNELDANDRMFEKGQITGDFHEAQKQAIQKKYAPPGFYAEKAKGKRK